MTGKLSLSKEKVDGGLKKVRNQGMIPVPHRDPLSTRYYPPSWFHHGIFLRLKGAESEPTPQLWVQCLKLYGSAETSKARIIQVPKGPAIIMSMAELVEKYEYAGSRTLNGYPPDVEDPSVYNATDFYFGGVTTPECQKSNASGD